MCKGRIMLGEPDVLVWKSPLSHSPQCRLDVSLRPITGLCFPQLQVHRAPIPSPQSLSLFLALVPSPHNDLSTSQSSSNLTLLSLSHPIFYTFPTLLTPHCPFTSRCSPRRTIPPTHTLLSHHNLHSPICTPYFSHPTTPSPLPSL